MKRKSEYWTMTPPRLLPTHLWTPAAELETHGRPSEDSSRTYRSLERSVRSWHWRHQANSQPATRPPRSEASRMPTSNRLVGNPLLTREETRTARHLKEASQINKEDQATRTEQRDARSCRKHEGMSRKPWNKNRSLHKGNHREGERVLVYHKSIPVKYFQAAKH